MDLSVLAERLTAIEWAAQVRDLDPGQHVRMRPVWQMRVPGVDLGRKRVALVPVRCEYAADSDTYTIHSLGVIESGTSTGEERRVDDLRAAATVARWELIEHFRPTATAETRTAHASLALSVGRDLLSSTTMADLVDGFILDEFPGTVLPRVNTEGTCRKVDPERWLRTTIRTRMRELVRQRLGDPREGTAIRAASVSLGTTDVATLTRHLTTGPRRSRINDETVRRALALWMSADPMLAWRQIEQEPRR